MFRAIDLPFSIRFEVIYNYTLGWRKKVHFFEIRKFIFLKMTSIGRDRHRFSEIDFSMGFSYRNCFKNKIYDRKNHVVKKNRVQNGFFMKKSPIKKALFFHSLYRASPCLRQQLHAARSCCLRQGLAHPQMFRSQMSYPQMSVLKCPSSSAVKNPIFVYKWILP